MCAESNVTPVATHAQRSMLCSTCALLQVGADHSVAPQEGRGEQAGVHTAVLAPLLKTGRAAGGGSGVHGVVHCAHWCTTDRWRTGQGTAKDEILLVDVMRPPCALTVRPYYHRAPQPCSMLAALAGGGGGPTSFASQRHLCH